VCLFVDEWKLTERERVGVEVENECKRKKSRGKEKEEKEKEGEEKEKERPEKNNRMAGYNQYFKWSERAKKEKRA
jgi:hypothetical protein